MKEFNVYQVDAFAEKIFGGNPAGIVTNADSLTETEMQNIAREMNLSETAFVLRQTSGKANLKLRFFTPSQEVAFCGHATVGALFQLAKLDMFDLGKPGKNNVDVETGVGVLPAAIVNEGEASEVTFNAPSVDMVPYRLQGAAFAEAFGISPSLIKTGGTIFLDKTLNYVYIPTVSLQALGEQKFDFSHIREQFSKEGVVVFSLFSRDTFAHDSDLHARGLAPNVGIDEDPFTGSMQAGLVSAAKKNGYIAANQESIVTEQGHFIGRPGRAKVSHIIASDEFAITAGAVSVFSSTWRI